ncbi:PREDICTED: protein BPS1, chloroplastic-like [Camelina sativa]|uniref:Protein BPS1, chloroplastic-like n=1 Tax=Camelina sativa TaxID=90675 RepID=A0ABM0TJX4_CAMSA|nr:PREDICTED: protein BPS1, chloroplastic-like [Camelina sativa]XP_019088679.1 PREDICTED: protein BPS1, chloroplastic-like [Camelina sativa]
MSKTCKQDPSLRFFHFRNPLKILFKKSNDAGLSPKLLSLLNNFETNLTVSIRQLIPKDKNDIVSVSWMIQAMESLCETHKSIRTLVKDLELSVSDLEENLIYIYSDVSLKLLELCNAFFTSELDRLNHGNLLLKFAFSKLETKELQVSYIDSWNQHMVSKNPRIEHCGAVLSKLVESMDHHHHHISKKAKKKHSVKVKVLLRALYGVKVKTLYIFSVFAAAFSGSSKNLFYLRVSKEMEELPWAQALMELQNEVNPEIKNTLLSDRFTVIKDLEAVVTSVKKLNTAVQEGSVPNMLLLEHLKKSVIELSERFDLVSNETRSLSKIVISARDALFESLWKKYAEELGVTLALMIRSVKT